MRYGIEGAALFALASLSGCAFQTMEPAHRLGAGEVVLQAALDGPGFLYIPRLSLQGTIGVGDVGDVGAHIGTSIVMANAGVSGRWYAARRFALSLQSDAQLSIPEDSFFVDGRAGVITNTFRAGRVLATDDDLFYGGFQTMLLLPIGVDGNNDFSLNNSPGVGAGGYVGLGWDTQYDVDFQMEFSASPVLYFQDEGQYVVSPAPFVQLGFAVQWRPEKDPAPSPVPTEKVL